MQTDYWHFFRQFKQSFVHFLCLTNFTTKMVAQRIITKLKMAKIIGIPKISTAKARLYTMKLTIYAVNSSIPMPISVHFLPISSLIMLIEARQGVYSKQKTRKDRTEAWLEKYTTLVGRRIDSEISLKALASTPLNMAMEETTTSFATSPARSAETTAQLLKQRRTKIGAKNFPIVCRMLPSPSRTN